MSYKYPQQSMKVGARVGVYVAPDFFVHGTIVRCDADPFGVTIIRCDDGRYVLGSEHKYIDLIYLSPTTPSPKRHD